MFMIQEYGDECSEEEKDQEDLKNSTLHLEPLITNKIEQFSFQQNLKICPAPFTFPTKCDNSVSIKIENLSPLKELTYNVKYEKLFESQVGPKNPFHFRQADKNIGSGCIENTYISDFHFENQRRTFHSFGYAFDPSFDQNSSCDSIGVKNKLVVSEIPYKHFKEVTVFEKNKQKSEKRKKIKISQPDDINGFTGPWTSYEKEEKISKPTAEEKMKLDEILIKRNKFDHKQHEKESIDEKSVLHIQNIFDYQGRSFLQPSRGLEINLRSRKQSSRCFLPKAQIHTWKGHSKGIASIKWFPKTAHLLLSGSMDCRIKLWEMYDERRCIRTYSGHRQGVRDISFNNNGEQFLSAAYDKYVKLWDTEAGQCIARFISKKVPYCVKFNPDDDKQNLFVVGTENKKIVCWDIRSGEIIQEYDRHLGAVNTITFVDQNRRFVTTSDDKSIRVWEWDIPVDIKYIADPTIYSIPAVTRSPNDKWLACQSMDNKIVVFSGLNKFKLNRKKIFTGHMVAGYACTLDFSPDMSYLISGDADGKCYIWDWKTTKLCKKWKAHDNVCNNVLWHPLETSKVVTSGWDGLIKFWD